MRKEDVFSKYTGNLDWLSDNTIFLTKHGSHAYGTNIASSDIDLKGVALSPKSHYLGFVSKFEQADKGFGDFDCCIYDIKKLFTLATQGNPNIIELLFTDPGDWIYYNHIWAKIYQNKNLFISQEIKPRFLGYAVSQIKKMQTHRDFILHPPTHKPTRADFGLPENPIIPKEQRDIIEDQISKILDNWKVDLECLDEPIRLDILSKISDALVDMKLSSDDRYTAAANKIGLNDFTIQILKSERAYRSSLTNWQQYQNWVQTRNPKRYEMESRVGYCTKNAMHLVRLIKMAKEIISGKGVIVRRPDADELLNIRNGFLSYNELMEWVETSQNEIENLVPKIPKHPNRAKIDSLCIDIIEDFLKQ